MSNTRLFVPALALVLALAGCTSQQQKALDQAKKQAAATGQAQQVVTVDKDGNTITTVVQPPAQPQAQPVVTTTTTPPTAGAPKPVATGPTVSAVAQPEPAPVQVTLPAGTDLTVRVDQTISVKTSHAGDQFTGELVAPVVDGNGNEVAPKGTRVGGVVDASHKRGHFKGASVLELRLTSMELGGHALQIETRDLAEHKKGKGKRSAAMIGGGTGLGMLIGGVATGGAGLVIGGLAGAGAGTAAAGLTGNRDLVIPAESVVHFKLAQDVVVGPGQ